MQGPGPFFLGSHKGSYGTVEPRSAASAAAQGLAEPGRPGRADGRRAGGDFVGAGVERHRDGPVLIRLPALRCRPSLEL